MYAIFPYYSLALIHAFSLDAPMSIMIGGGHIYWVVDRHLTKEYLDKGGILLHTTNRTTFCRHHIYDCGFKTAHVDEVASASPTIADYGSGPPC